MLYEAALSPRARWYLEHLDPADHQQVVDCIHRLEQNPYPPAAQRGPLVIPGQAVYPDAFHCEGWAIAFRVVQDLFVFVEAIGPQWPPRHPSLRP